ncbi:type 1 glutamine amidotransferase family protein [Methanoplanus endosymbiosus]|uniref:Glutamine amidotransferase n=1 Tax=Methanoplanus endosymbiosus TaxID=33865 RepID=A0A9E7TJ56_9EURY|nr:type 1 glutamine amidotransferase family protein [Methanoplanus endosymbiosus]UUX91410.1 glutamine amidotransferase [Methanoplanus endosymbiosus]
MDKNVYLYVCPDLADWEASLAIAMISNLNTDLPKKMSYNIVTFGLTRDPVKTSGGVTILPDCDVDAVDLTEAAMVILPGSSHYEHDDPAQLVPLIRNCINNNIPVAAICGGTLFLARHGFLDTVRHTSCGQEWLKEHAPDYRGEHLYEAVPSVSDGGIITANPLGFVDFAYNIIQALDVFSPEFLEIWHGAVKSGYLDVDQF